MVNGDNGDNRHLHMHTIGEKHHLMQAASCITLSSTRLIVGWDGVEIHEVGVFSLSLFAAQRQTWDPLMPTTSTTRVRNRHCGFLK